MTASSLRSMLLGFVGLAAVAQGCDKANNVTSTTNNLGNPCGVGVSCADGKCTLGFCRKECTTDSDCNPDGVCLSDGQSSGCRLVQEQKCSASSPCSTGLTCSTTDNSCRVPCDENRACEIAGQKCNKGTCETPADAGVGGASGAGGNAGSGGAAGVDAGNVGGGGTPGVDGGEDGEAETGGQDAGCGHLGEDCCAGETCLQVGSTCLTGKCSPCGIEEAACCEGTCGPDLTCGPESLCHCGNRDQACCSGTICDPGFTCNSGKCTCGDKAGVACCSDPPQCAGTLACAGLNCTCATAIVGGYGVAWILRSDGSAWKRGSGDEPLADATPLTRNGQLVTGGGSLGNGSYHACMALKAGGGTIVCWPTENQLMNSNAYGQLGRGNVSLPTDWEPLEVATSEGGPSLSGAAHVVAGSVTTCAIMSTNGSVRCWGAGWDGMLGNGWENNSAIPVEVLQEDGPAIANVDQIAVGSTHTCARKADGTLWCWGGNASGQLGIGSGATKKTRAVQVTALSNKVRQVSVDSSFTCATVTDDSLWCWGSNTFGQLGNGLSTGTATTPVQLALAPVREVVVLNQAACAVKTDSSLWCWGTYHGKLTPAPRTAQGIPITNVWFVGKESTFPCAIKTNGKVLLTGSVSETREYTGLPCP